MKSFQFVEFPVLSFFPSRFSFAVFCGFVACCALCWCLLYCVPGLGSCVLLSHLPTPFFFSSACLLCASLWLFLPLCFPPVSRCYLPLAVLVSLLFTPSLFSSVGWNPTSVCLLHCAFLSRRDSNVLTNAFKNRLQSWSDHFTHISRVRRSFISWLDAACKKRTRVCVYVCV